MKILLLQNSNKLFLFTLDKDYPYVIRNKVKVLTAKKLLYRHLYVYLIKFGFNLIIFKVLTTVW